MRVVHDRDRLPLGLEPRQDRPRLTAFDPDQLDRNPPLDRFGLVGLPDRAHTLSICWSSLKPPGDDRPGNLGGNGQRRRHRVRARRARGLV